MLACIRGRQVKATGLLVHKRFYNLPLELIGHLHRNLADDLVRVFKALQMAINDPIYAEMY